MIPPQSTDRQLGALPLAVGRRRELDQPFPRPPLVLLEQHTAKLCQRVRSDIVECPEYALTVFDGECDDLVVERERLLKKRTGRLVHERDEIAYVLVRNPQAGEIHEAERTQASRWSTAAREACFGCARELVD